MSFGGMWQTISTGSRLPTVIELYNRLKPYEALFDMDGVLVETEPIIYESIKHSEILTTRCSRS
jgi:hypothetical protein